MSIGPLVPVVGGAAVWTSRRTPTGANLRLAFWIISAGDTFGALGGGSSAGALLSEQTRWDGTYGRTFDMVRLFLHTALSTVRAPSLEDGLILTNSPAVNSQYSPEMPATSRTRVSADEGDIFIKAFGGHCPRCRLPLCSWAMVCCRRRIPRRHPFRRCGRQCWHRGSLSSPAWMSWRG